MVSRSKPTTSVKMKGGVGYRLSPNEAARVVQEEKERRRKLRIVQVREMAKVNAAKIRQAVKEEHTKQIRKLSHQVKSEWEAEKEEKIRKLQEQYDASLDKVGEGHAEALDRELNAKDRALIAIEDNKIAEKRHKAALKKLHDERNQQAMRDNRQIIARQIALDLERARAAEIASLPPPAPDPLYNICIPKVKPIKMTDLNAFSTTHYHLPQDIAVERATKEELELMNARNAAADEQRRYDVTNDENQRLVNERREKARLRHKHAREKELLKQDYEQMLHDLSDLRRDDIHRRQQIVAKIPKQIFVPPHRRLEEDKEEQIVMERAFEDMYMRATDNQGNLTLALDLHEPPSSSPTATLDLSTMDDSQLDSQDSQTVPMQLYIPKGRAASCSQTVTSSSGDVTSVSEQTTPLQDVTNQPLRGKDVIDTSKPPDTGLRKLLGRIRNQRERCHAEEEGAGPFGLQENQPIRVPVTNTATSSDFPANLTQYTISSIDTGTSEQQTTPSLTQYTIASTSAEQSHNRSGSPSGTAAGSPTLPTTRGRQSPGKRGGGTSPRRLSQGKHHPTETTTPAKNQSQGKIGKAASTYGRSPQKMEHEEDTLFHPMEQAAKLRNQPLAAANAEVSPFLAKEKERQSRIQAEHLRIQEQTQQYLREIEKQRSELERKYAEIEARKEAYKSQLSEYTLPSSEAETTEAALGSVLHTPRKAPNSFINYDTDINKASGSGVQAGSVQYMPRKVQNSFVEYGTNYSASYGAELTQRTISSKADTSGASGGTTNSGTVPSGMGSSSREEEYLRRVRDFPAELTQRTISSKADTSGTSNGTNNTGMSNGTSREEEHIRRIRDYQSKLLERQKPKQQLIPERSNASAEEYVNGFLGTGSGEISYARNVDDGSNEEFSRYPDLSLSAQMASGQYFNGLTEGGAEAQTSQYEPNQFGMGSYPRQLETGSNGRDGFISAVTNQNGTGTYQDGSIDVDGFINAMLSKQNSMGNSQPPVQGVDSPNHRVQDWLAYYQQLEELSSKENSPLTQITDQSRLSKGKDNLLRSFESPDSRTPQSRFAADSVLPSEVQSLPQFGASTQQMGISAYSRHLVDQARETVLKAQNALYNRDVGDEIGANAETNEMNNIFASAGLKHNISDSELRRESGEIFHPMKEDISAAQDVADTENLLHRLNDLVLDPRSSMENPRSTQFLSMLLDEDSLSLEELSRSLEEARSMTFEGQTQSSRPLPLFAQSQLNAGAAHIPHELSTIQELEESSRRWSHLGASSSTKKRLSSSPIKEDHQSPEANMRLQLDMSCETDSDVIAGRDPHSATEVAGVSDSYDPGAFHPNYSGITIDNSIHSDNSDQSKSAPSNGKTAQTSFERKTWADLLSHEATPAQDDKVQLEEPHVWVEYQSSSGGRKLEKVNLGDLQKKEQSDKVPAAETSAPLSRPKINVEISAPTVEQETDKEAQPLAAQPIAAHSKRLSEESETQRRLYELYGAIPGFDDLDVTRASDTDRPHSSTPTSSSRSTVRRVAAVDHSPIRNESFQPLLPDNTRDTAELTENTRDTTEPSGNSHVAAELTENSRRNAEKIQDIHKQLRHYGNASILDNNNYGNTAASLVTAKLFGSTYADMTTGDDAQFTALKSDSSSTNTSPTNNLRTIESDLSQLTISRSVNRPEESTPPSVPKAGAQLSQLIKSALEQDSMALSQHSLSRTHQSVGPSIGESLSQYSFTDHSYPFTSDMRGITDESDLSLVNYSITSDRPNNQSASLATRSPGKPANMSSIEEFRAPQSFQRSPDGISMTSQPMTSPQNQKTSPHTLVTSQLRQKATGTSPRRQMTSHGSQPMTSPFKPMTSPLRPMTSDTSSFSHLSATPSDEHSRSLTSFERHEDSLRTSSEYSLLQSQPKDKFTVLSIPVEKDLSGSDRSRVRFDRSPSGAEKSRVRFDVSQSAESSLQQEEDHGGIKSINIHHVQDEASEEKDNEALQKAFEKRRQQFIRNSQKRKAKAKERAAEKLEQQKSHHVNTLQSWKKSRGLNAQKSKAGSSKTAQVEKNKNDRENEEKEMKKRTERLYSRLEEVQQQKLLQDRKKLYADNRQRMKEYQQKHQERVKKKTHAKK